MATTAAVEAVKDVAEKTEKEETTESPKEEETSKTETSEDSEKVDHGQSNPEDKDMYTTRSWGSGAVHADVNELWTLTHDSVAKASWVRKEVAISKHIWNMISEISFLLWKLLNVAPKKPKKSKNLNTILLWYIFFFKVIAKYEML